MERRIQSLEDKWKAANSKKSQRQWDDTKEHSMEGHPHLRQDYSPQDDSNPHKGSKRLRRQQQQCQIRQTKVKRELWHKVKSGLFDICMEFTGGILWFVPQIVGQPKPSYRKKNQNLNARISVVWIFCYKLAFFIG